jgi:translation elongation factor EF-Tu-like GTPase
MTEPEIGVTLLIHIDLLTASQGGRTQPVQSGYRPLCVVATSDGTEVVIGLCELQLADDLPPGRSGEGRLSFSADVSDEVRSLLSPGSRFSLAEGARPIGKAEVRGIE